MVIEEQSHVGREDADRLAKRMHVSLLREGKHIYLRTSGSSMWPFMQEGDTVKIRPAGENDIEVGDVVAVDNEGKTTGWFYVHRVIRILRMRNRILYVTKGDGIRGGMDEPVGRDRVVGKVVEIERGVLRMDLESSPCWKHINRGMARVSSVRPWRKARAGTVCLKLIILVLRFLSGVKAKIVNPTGRSRRPEACS